jgi:hypothetical protein
VTLSEETEAVASAIDLGAPMLEWLRKLGPFVMPPEPAAPPPPLVFAKLTQDAELRNYLVSLLNELIQTRRAYEALAERHNAVVDYAGQASEWIAGECERKARALERETRLGAFLLAEIERERMARG